MRVCVPAMGTGMSERICDHFGRAPYFLIYDEEAASFEVLENRSEHMGGSGKPPELIASRGAQVIICSGLGPKAVNILRSFGIRTYVGASGTVADAISSWKGGQLQSADLDNACKEHRDGHVH